MLEHTSSEKRGKDLIGMQVISIQDGRRLGEVTALLIRREDAAVAAVRIGTQLAPGPAVSFTNLQLVGVDVILVNSISALDPPLPTETVRALDDGVLGRKVLTVSGEQIGTISGFWVTSADGHIAAYRVHPDAGLLSRLTNLLHNDTFEIPSGQVHVLGVDALIVADTAANLGTVVPQPRGANAPHAILAKKESKGTKVIEKHAPHH